MSHEQVLRKGVLFKKGSGQGPFGRKNWKPRYFVLTPRILRYYTYEDGELKGELDISRCDESVIEVMPADSMKTGSSASTIWRIAINAPNRRLLVAAGTEVEMNDWIDKIIMAIRINHGQTVDMRQSTTEVRRRISEGPGGRHGQQNGTDDAAGGVIGGSPVIKDFQNFATRRSSMGGRHSLGHPQEYQDPQNIEAERIRQQEEAQLSQYEENIRRNIEEQERRRNQQEVEEQQKVAAAQEADKRRQETELEQQRARRREQRELEMKERERQLALEQQQQQEQQQREQQQRERQLQLQQQQQYQYSRSPPRGGSDQHGVGVGSLDDAALREKMAGQQAEQQRLRDEYMRQQQQQQRKEYIRQQQQQQQQYDLQSHQSAAPPAPGYPLYQQEQNHHNHHQAAISTGNHEVEIVRRQSRQSPPQPGQSGQPESMEYAF
jgi:hypothetical protein